MAFKSTELPVSNLSVYYKTSKYPTKGNLHYAYRPLRNYRDDTGALQDFNTVKLNFDVQHPVEINCQPSYDNSVNLILTDNKSAPKLINTRFTVKENNTYEIIDHSGNYDTNIYDDSQFTGDTSLNKQFVSIPKITFNGTLSGGFLKVGNYVLYITYADADGNETDIVSESGTISCFIGNEPQSIKGGYRDENSGKLISITLTNLDTNYNYLKVYYTRVTSDVDQNTFKTAYKITQNYLIQSDSCTIFINGQEPTEDISIENLNIRYFIPQTVKTATQCSNRLFIGNISTGTIDFEDLRDVSLRIYPTVVQNKADMFIGNLDYNYKDISRSANKNEYYNSQNIYYRVGYWNEEFYRFGIVYVLNNGSLSPVFNISGNSSINKNSVCPYAFNEITNENGQRQYLSIDSNSYLVNQSDWNSKGVCRLQVEAENAFEVLGIKFNIPSIVQTHLNGKVKGFFFVRQKRIPTKLAQMYIMPHDAYSGLPLINAPGYDSGEAVYESFLDSNRSLNNNYKGHLQQAVPDSHSFIGICPEAELYQSYYNTIFTGANFSFKYSSNNTDTELLSNDPKYERHYYSFPSVSGSNRISFTGRMGSIPDSAPLIVFDNYRFRASAGEAVDVSRFLYVTSKNKTNKATNIVRGNWGPYIGIVTNSNLSYGKYIDVMAPGFQDTSVSSQMQTRFVDSSEYMAIGDRYQINEEFTTGIVITKDINNDNVNNTVLQIDQYRGDCFICQVTHRINRNFQDPSALTNDIIIDANTWKDNYDVDDVTKTAKINRGDVNAVGLGTWVTVKVYASRNLCLRTEDLSYPTEAGINGHNRGFYPYQSMSIDGCYKIPESSVINDGYGCTLGERWNFTLADAPYYKNIFQTRIYYSDIAINDAFKNGYRTFREQNYRDYPITYGGLMKMVTFKSNIIAIFEHGVCLLPVNERTQMADSVGGALFINTNNVLPENPSSIISDKYGTQWPESVVITPRAIYGVDTVAKKIWNISLTDLSLNCISDFKVQQFLNKNIDLGEFDTIPTIGIRNVKTHYNAFKNDVMFTFYNNVNSSKETVWNLCFNENSNKFTTFYSWVPSYSESIDNMYFSFDRNTSKWISKLAASTSSNPIAGIISVNNVAIDTWNADGTLISYNGNFKTSDPISFILEPDSEKNYNLFEISEKDNQYYLKVKGQEYKDRLTSTRPVLYLNIKCLNTGQSATIALTTQTIIDANYKGNNDKDPHLSTFFWKHGQAGLQNIADKIKPTNWYGQQHPFEIEFVVNDQPSIHKIFRNLQIISNNAEPESFHYQIIGDVYDFADEKANMYYRQEATKCLYQNLGSDITYDSDYLKDPHVKPEHHRKSVIFPLTYVRQDSLDTVQDEYKSFNEVINNWQNNGTFNRDYEHLSGSEVTFDPVTGQFSLQEHSKALNIKDNNIGRLRGNMQYKEDRFDIQMGSIIYSEKNESNWEDRPPIAIIGPLPSDIATPTITASENSNTIKELEKSEIKNYTLQDISSQGWSSRKETTLRDKSIRIRIRYSGKKLAIITSILTIYTQSYA